MFDKQRVLDDLYDGLYLVTRGRRITYWNRAAETITGYRANEVIGLCCHEGPLKHVDGEGRDLCSQGCPLDWAMAHRQQNTADIFLHHKEGHRIPVRVKVSPYCDDGGEVIGAAELFADNTEAMLTLEHLAELETATLLDPLTGLGNRAYLESQAQRYLKEMVRQPKHIGVLAIEIDNLEAACDRLGSAKRQRILQVVAETLRANCRPLDLFGHVDDGSFVGLIHDVTSNQLFTVGRKLGILIDKSYIVVEAELLNVTVTVGGTILQPDDTLQDAVARCEKQLYLARKSGEKISIPLKFFAAGSGKGAME